MFYVYSFGQKAHILVRYCGYFLCNFGDSLYVCKNPMQHSITIDPSRSPSLSPTFLAVVMIAVCRFYLLQDNYCGLDRVMLFYLLFGDCIFMAALFFRDLLLQRFFYGHSISRSQVNVWN